MHCSRSGERISITSLLAPPRTKRRHVNGFKCNVNQPNYLGTQHPNSSRVETAFLSFISSTIENHFQFSRTRDEAKQHPRVKLAPGHHEDAPHASTLHSIVNEQMPRENVCLGAYRCQFLVQSADRSISFPLSVHERRLYVFALGIKSLMGSAKRKNMRPGI